jgi:hypothetical protein
MEDEFAWGHFTIERSEEMNRKNILSGPGSEDIILRAVALAPVIVLCLFVMIHGRSRPAHEVVPQSGAGGSSGSVLLTGMKDWGELDWEEKERRVSSAIVYFREQKNCAILRSPGHYVVLFDQLLQEDPSVRNKNLLTVLHGLAIQDYDFYSGMNADEQALKFLGPELFRKNLEARRAEEARLQPVDVKNQK